MKLDVTLIDNIALSSIYPTSFFADEQIRAAIKSYTIIEGEYKM